VNSGHIVDEGGTHPRLDSRALKETQNLQPKIDEGERQRHTKKMTKIEIDKEMQKDRERQRDAERQRETKRCRKTERDKERQREREIQKDRERQRDTERQI
jgi:zinc finger CCCH domain-containing protein 13